MTLQMLETRSERRSHEAIAETQSSETSVGSEMSVQVRRGRGRPKVRSDEQQKSIIVEGAISLFLKHGYFTMRMDDISAACHVSKRTLYRLFPSKLELFRAMAAVARGQLFNFDQVKPGASVEEALVSIFCVNVDDAVEESRTAFLRQTAADAVFSPELADILREECMDKARQRLAERFAEWGEAGLLRANNPQAAAFMLMDMVFGAAHGEPRNGASGRDFTRTCIQYFVNGVR